MYIASEFYFSKGQFEGYVIYKMNNYSVSFQFVNIFNRAEVLCISFSADNFRKDYLPPPAPGLCPNGAESPGPPPALPAPEGGRYVFSKRAA